MYTFSSKLKTFSIALVILGALGMAYGFFTAPKTTDEIKEMMQHAESSHEATVAEHATASTHEAVTNEHKAEGEHTTDTHDAHAAEHHLEHMLMQAQNRPWAAMYVAMIFFLLISVCVLVFYAMQRAASAGWSPVLFRVMEGLTAYIVPGSILILLFLIYSSVGHGNHLFAWMYTSIDPTAENYDFAMVTKDWWLNIPGWLIRSVIYVSIWIGFRHLILKNSRAQDEATDTKHFMKSFNYSVLFLALFLLSELFMAFDWLMAIDHHWFSQLYPFYVFSSMLVTAITIIALVTVYLKSRGFLPNVNDSHIHDLGKYMFGFSIFWAYLWFDQFMLQWYANIPEEVVYFMPRLLGEYQPLFIGMVFLNFTFPLLLLMNKTYKNKPWFLGITGLAIIVGHYIDVFVMIAPGTVGNELHFGIPEIGAILFFLGLFIFFTFNALTKAPLHAKGNPFMKESEVYQYH